MSSQAVAPRGMAAPYKPGPKGSGVLSGHPQREKVLQAMINQEPLRAIARWVTPKVSRVTLMKLHAQVKEQRSAAELLQKVKQIEGLASVVSGNEQSVDQLTKAAVLGSVHLARIEKLLEPLERQAQLADVENDRMGLSSVAKAALSAIRTQAELDGSLANANPVQHNTFQVVVLPGQEVVIGAEQPAIEATCEPAE